MPGTPPARAVPTATPILECSHDPPEVPLSADVPRSSREMSARTLRAGGSRASGACGCRRPRAWMDGLVPPDHQGQDPAARLRQFPRAEPLLQAQDHFRPGFRARAVGGDPGPALPGPDTVPRQDPQQGPHRHRLTGRGTRQPSARSQWRNTSRAPDHHQRGYCRTALHRPPPLPRRRPAHRTPLRQPPAPPALSTSPPSPPTNLRRHPTKSGRCAFAARAQCVAGRRRRPAARLRPGGIGTRGRSGLSRAAPAPFQGVRLACRKIPVPGTAPQEAAT